MNPSRRRLVQSRVVANGDDTSSSESDESSSSDDSGAEDNTLNARRQALIKKRTEQTNRYSGGNAGSNGMAVPQALQPDVRVDKGSSAENRKDMDHNMNRFAPAQESLDGGEENESSDSSSSSSSSEDEIMHCKVSFVPKNKRDQRKNENSSATSSSMSVNKIVSSKNIGSKSLQERAAQSRRMVIDSTVDIEDEVIQENAAAKRPSDEDGIDALAEMEAWRLREKVRVEKFTLQ